MFAKLNKKNLELSQNEAWQILEQGEYAIISTIGETGYPYGFPMSYVILNQALYYHGSPVGHKTDCLNYSNKVSITVVGQTELLPEKLDTNYESVIAFGKASEVEGEEKKEALFALVRKYAKGFEEEGLASLEEEFSRTSVIKIEIENITGKRRWGDQR